MDMRNGILNNFNDNIQLLDCCTAPVDVNIVQDMVI